MPQAGAYTLNSIAAVVIGGTSLLGGIGRRHRLALRRPGDPRHLVQLPRSSTSHPLLQPLFEGIVLLGAVSIGAAGCSG